MSDDLSFLHFAPSRTADDGIGVRFPPGLGLIPPRDVPHPRIKGRSSADVAA